MSKWKQKSPAAPPRQVGDLTMTEPVIERRKWGKRRSTRQSLPLLDTDGTSVRPGELGNTGASAGPGRSGAGEHRPGPAAEGGSLFQSYGHCCDKEEVSSSEFVSDQVHSPEDLGEVVGEAYRIRPCRCRRWFCEWCGPRLGARLRDRLLARLAAFNGVYGITLTLDGNLFASPEKGWQYVMDERLLARLVRELHRRGHLHSKAYFWAVEFQGDTKQAHWHLLLDATFVPYGEIVEIWSRFRPPTAPPLPEPITAENYKGHAPAFGSVRYTPSDNREKAAYYATKYLTKSPRDGYPDWALDHEGRMPRYGHSHRFFPRLSGHDPMCFCAQCCGEVEPPSKARFPKKPRAKSAQPRRERKTIRERLAECGQSCTVVRVKRVRLPDGSIVDGKGRFEGKFEIPFREVCEFLEINPEGQWQLEVDGRTVTEVEEFVKQRDAAREAA